MYPGRSLRMLAMAAIGSAALAAAPAHAQDLPEPDAEILIQPVLTPDNALVTAQQQESAGDLPGAAATLKRALLTNAAGGTTRLRLHYVALLCRLGDRQTARSEIARIDGLEIEDADWARTTAACGALPRPASASRQTGQGLNGEIAFGLAYDSDLANALLVQFNLPGAIPADDGASFFGSAYLAGRAPIGRGFVYGTGGGATKNSLAGPTLDYQTGDAQFGLGFQGLGFELSFGATGGHSIVAAKPFLTEYGGEAALSLALAAETTLSLRGELVHQDYIGSTALFSRDGTRIDASIELQGRAGASTNYWLGAAYEGKNAATVSAGYSGARAFGALRETLSANGTYLSAFATIRYVAYEDEPGFLPVDELRWYGRVAMGVPILTRGLNLEAGANYSWRVYNDASNFRDYESFGAELRLVWTFGN